MNVCVMFSQHWSPVIEVWTIRLCAWTASRSSMTAHASSIMMSTTCMDGLTPNPLMSEFLFLHIHYQMYLLVVLIRVVIALCVYHHHYRITSLLIIHTSLPASLSEEGRSLLLRLKCWQPLQCTSGAGWCPETWRYMISHIYTSCPMQHLEIMRCCTWFCR